MTFDTLLTVRGTIALGEQVTAERGSIATVKVVAADHEVLAAAAFDVDEIPAPFSLTLDPALTTAPESLFIWAALRSETGMWGTVELTPVTTVATSVQLTKIET